MCRVGPWIQSTNGVQRCLLDALKIDHLNPRESFIFHVLQELPEQNGRRDIDIHVQEGPLNQNHGCNISDVLTDQFKDRSLGSLVQQHSVPEEVVPRSR